MVVLSKIVEDLPGDYGYVLFVAVGSGFLNMWLAGNVGRARKQYSVPYPDMYSAEHKEFNCVQRAHQNTLEMYPSFLFYLLSGGLMFPRVTAAAGVMWILGRIQFARGYYTGNPDNRRRGAFGLFGMLILLGNTCALAAHKLQLIPSGSSCVVWFVSWGVRRVFGTWELMYRTARNLWFILPDRPTTISLQLVADTAPAIHGAS